MKSNLLSKTDFIAQHCQENLAFFNSELFKNVQMAHIFEDSKTFADAIPNAPLNKILQHYKAEKQNTEEFNLANFVEKYFILPEQNEIYTNKPGDNVNQHIENLWQLLQKSADKPVGGSLLPLKKPYIVPGGRFREIYYWDSYFTALGLVESGRIGLVESMLDNFIDLQEQYGRVPNGNRSYYLSRSQPPILALMVELLLPFKEDTDAFLASGIKAIETEYKFWMQGCELLSDTNNEHLRVVRMPNGSLLNRYWDENAEPRPESYREDIELSTGLTPTDKITFYRNIRAACESGWDFSSRWLGKDNSLASIRTSEILPVDLNCLLYKQESLLSTYYAQLGDKQNSQVYFELALKRKAAINHYMWSEQDDFFFDYDLNANHQSSVKSLAGVLPLFVRLASQTQADKVAKVIKDHFLKAGGLVTTVIKSQQQWDAPNGWAPLHWFTAQGLIQYQHTALAEDIMQRWLNTVEHYFAQTGKIMEKYNVCQQSNKACGGEYDVQEGFGWTNGVCQVFYRKLGH